MMSTVLPKPSKDLEIAPGQGSLYCFLHENYMELKAAVCTLKVKNDCAERALVMLTEFSVNRLTRDKNRDRICYRY